MAKFTRSNFLEGAANNLQQQNFPAVYKNAKAALALGDIRATYYLCAYYRHQIVEMSKTSGMVPEIISNFGIMYKLSEYYQVTKYTDFTRSYQSLFDNSKTPPALIKAVKDATIEYTKYLQIAQKQYPEGTLVDIRTAEHIASAMVQFVLQQVADNNSKAQPYQGGPHYVAEPVEMKMKGLPPPKTSAPLPASYAPQDLHYLGSQTPLMGHYNDNDHATICPGKMKMCTIL